MVKITPEKFVAQWIDAPLRFIVNVHNFEVKAGQAAVEVFQGSFDKLRLNTHGAKKWAKWQGKYFRHGTLMEETGTLRNSIKVKEIRKHKITIFTDPGDFVGNKRHKGFCFAAVHNNLNSLTNKPSRGPKEERQFIGHSTILATQLKQLSSKIFQGFPK